MEQRTLCQECLCLILYKAFLRIKIIPILIKSEGTSLKFSTKCILLKHGEWIECIFSSWLKKTPPPPKQPTLPKYPLPKHPPPKKVFGSKSITYSRIFAAVRYWFDPFQFLITPNLVSAHIVKGKDFYYNNFLYPVP